MKRSDKKLCRRARFFVVHFYQNPSSECSPGSISAAVCSSTNAAFSSQLNINHIWAALSFPPPLSAADTVLLLADGSQLSSIYVDRLVRWKHTQGCWWCRWPLRAGLWPVYSPVSPHCFTALFGHRNRWFPSQAYTEKTKGGTVGVAVVTSVPTRWQIHAGKARLGDRNGHMNYCGLLSRLSDGPVRVCRFPLRIKASHIFLLRASRGHFQVSNLAPWKECGEKSQYLDR